jgi:ABC-type Fe3+-hydroxamate transport system substrate-binding protein
MIRVQDQMNNVIELSKAPQRIISLVPSQTELLFDLGLGDRVVGITKFCIHPNEWFREKERIGGTKNVNINKVKSLYPDLVIGNKEENTLTDINALKEIVPVWMSDIYTLNDAYGMISGLGSVCQRDRESNNILDEIKVQFSKLNKFSSEKSVLYLIWKEPFMGAGKDTFIDDILTEQLGFRNVLKEKSRYPSFELSAVGSPDFIFLSTEPYPFNDSHVDGLRTLFPDSKVILVDGEYFTWYGSRLMGAPKYFQKLLDSLELH